MIRPSISGLLVLLAAAMPAAAQDVGGLRLAAGLNGGPVGLARPLPVTFRPLVTAHEMQGGMAPGDRQALHQNMITKTRGDTGFLGGFAFGAPVSASRQVIQEVGESEGGYGHGRGHGRQPIVINNTGPLAVTVGNDNLVQQQSANGPGPIAQQQVATVGGQGRNAGGGAVNVVSGGGNIIQRAPGG